MMKDLDSDQIKRMQKAAFIAALLIFAGVLYLLFFSSTDIGLPCIIRRITGFRCPGCGMTHALSDVLRLDIKGAFSDNLLFIPIILYILRVAYNYVRTYVMTGRPVISSGSDKLDLVFVVILLIWWPVRNILSI